jgi:cytidylate kinase
LELIAKAKQCKYEKHTKSFNEYTEEEMNYAAIYEVLKNDLIVYALIIACRKYSPIKILIKYVLKEYTEKFS